MDKYIGKRLDGRYEIADMIGVGGMAIVYKAFDKIENKTVAIKILKDEYLGNAEFTRRFKNESKAIAILSHQNIVKVYDVGFGENIKYIVMEYIDGITLKQYIEQHGTLRWNEACHFTAQILEALNHAHSKGIIHRDIKPQNIMVCRDGKIKVTDFGIARFAQSEQRTITDKAIGSVHYISPEQAKGGHIDEKADLYSLGVILYEMLTGKLPFESDSAVSVAIMQLQEKPISLREINSTIPQGLEDITLRAMQKDSARRYQSAYEMLKDLKKFMDNPKARFKTEPYVDSQPTRYLDKPEEDDYYEDDYYEEGNKTVKIITAIAVSLVLAVAIFAGYFFLFRTNGSGIYELSCPDLVGMNYYTDIKNDPNLNKLNIVIETEINGTEDYGTITYQSIRAGKTIKSTAEIQVRISKGQEEIIIPEIDPNADAQSAEFLLTSKGLKVVIKKRYDESVLENCVISTSPEAGETVENGTQVIMYVSLGAPNSYLRMPYIVNLMESDAKTRITEAGLTVGKKTEQPSSKPKGVVLEQEIEPGSEVASGTTVNYVVSTGKEETVKATIKLELPNDSRTVVVNLFQDGESVYESSKIKLSNKKDISVPIEGNGKMEYSVVFTGSGLDEFEYMSFTFDFETKSQSNVKIHSLPKQETTTKPTTKPTTTKPTTKPQLTTATEAPEVDPTEPVNAPIEE